MSRPAVFLDRDGVLNVAFRGDYVRQPSQFQWVPGACEAVGALTSAGWPVVVVTNQSGIARGYYTSTDLDDIHGAMRRDLEACGGHLDGVFVCPHTDEDACACRKPLPGLLLQAARELDLDLPQSFFVGDSEIDVMAGQAAGCHTVAVSTGLYSPEEIARWTARPERVFATLPEAAAWLNAVREGSAAG